MLTPEERELMEREAHAVHALLNRVPERSPPPHLKRAILDALPPRTRHAPEIAVGTSWFARIRSSLSQLNLAARQMEEFAMSKKALIIGTTAVAFVAIIGGAVIEFSPTGGEGGTIGGGDEISGVQRASRYRGRAMSASDVTIANPEISILFQNQDILTLVKSDVFREAMNNEAFRELQSSESFRALLNNESYRALLSSESYRLLESNESYRALMANDAARALFLSESYRELANNEAYRLLENNEAFRAVQSSEAFRLAMANESFRVMMANESFRVMMANDAFRAVMANDAFRSLQASDAFRSLARSASASEAFMSEAMRVQQ
jgi:PAS domain-containing protein